MKKKILFLWPFLFSWISCGVKGPPLPAFPKTPEYLDFKSLKYQKKKPIPSPIPSAKSLDF